jgi:hypothetical protein
MKDASVEMTYLKEDISVFVFLIFLKTHPSRGQYCSLPSKIIHSISLVCYENIYENIYGDFSLLKKMQRKQ